MTERVERAAPSCSGGVAEVQGGGSALVAGPALSGDPDRFDGASVRRPGRPPAGGLVWRTPVLLVGAALLLGTAACTSPALPATPDSSAVSAPSPGPVTSTEAGATFQVPASALPPGSFDYQLGGDYSPPEGVRIVVRQWSDGAAEPGAYSICYINAFQTEAELGVPDGPDEWPQEVVREDLEDAGWPGEHPIDISTPELRRIAADHVAGHFRTCAAKGFAAAELDNLDTYTRYPGASFDRADAVAYAQLLVASAAEAGLVLGQKNAADLLEVGRTGIGFTFAVVEECGQFDECQAFVDTYGSQVLAVEYTETGFAAACAAIGDTAPVILRDLSLSVPTDPDYVFRTC